MPPRWIPEFEWDEHNEAKLVQRHGVSVHEAEACFANPHIRRRNGGDLFLFGKTDDGRFLLLVYEQKPSGIVRVYSGRNMTPDEKQRFRKQIR